MFKRFCSPRVGAWLPATRYLSSDLRTAKINLQNPTGSAESKAALDDLFKFHSGRWLTNDRFEREARKVHFDLKGLVQLLHEVANVTQNQVEIREIMPLFEGKHNKLFKISLEDNRSYVLRIPYAIGLLEYRQARLQSEAATLSYLSEHVFPADSKFRAAAPISYSASVDNVLKTPYILTSYIEGTKLAAEWVPGHPDIEQKRPVLDSMADLAGALLKPEFSAYGSIFFASDAPQGYEHVKINDKYVIGPVMEKLFWKSEVATKHRGPFKTWEEYLKAIGEVQLAYSRAHTGEGSLSTKCAMNFAKLSSSMFPALPPPQTSARLFDPDLSPQNVISQDNHEKLWLIDVENTSIKPYVLHGLPWFVRNPGDRVYSLEDVENYDKMSDQHKQIVQHMLALTQNEYVYEQRLKSSINELILAHHPNLKRREEVVHRALNTDITSGAHNDLSYSMLKVLELWEMLSPGTKPPFEYTQEELKRFMEDMMNYNYTLVKNRFLEAKGFVPADIFDELLGTGALKVVDEKLGNYEFTEEYLNSQDPFKQ